MQLPQDLVRTLAVIADAGTLDAASRTLNITPSAVSQRLRALEEQLGRALVIRSKPVKLTDAGNAVVRFVKQTALLEQAALRDLGLSGDLGSTPQLSVIFDPDLRSQWFTALERVTRVLPVTLLIYEDQDTDRMQAGDISGALTIRNRAAVGWSCVPVGRARFEAVASPKVLDKWGLPDPTGALLAATPMVVLRDREDRHDAFCRRVHPDAEGAPRTVVPSGEALLDAILAGMGWGLLPAAVADPLIGHRRLGRASALRGPSEDYYWHRWSVPSLVLDRVTQEILSATAGVLDQSAVVGAELRGVARA